MITLSTPLVTIKYEEVNIKTYVDQSLSFVLTVKIFPLLKTVQVSDLLNNCNKKNTIKRKKFISFYKSTFSSHYLPPKQYTGHVIVVDCINFSSMLWTCIAYSNLHFLNNF